LIRVTRVLAKISADLVVSHEEFAALRAAHIYGKPTLLLTDFFPSLEVRKDSLRYAQRILFIEHQGIFAEPREVKGRVTYLGPVLRPLAVSPADRERARQALELSAATKLVSVIPGAWANERRVPLFDLIVAAFRALPFAEKRLVWIAGTDQDELSKRSAAMPEIKILAQHPRVEELMVASDLVVTKANRGTTIDLARLAIPSISLSSGLNPIDDAILPRLQSNLALDARGMDAAFLTRKIEAAIRAQEAGPALVPSPL
jgi:UDP-N-acetylglucosamine:LPS N-acetylglucosamine transferase